MNDLSLVITIAEYKVIRDCLLELPAKTSMVLIAKLDAQVIEQTKEESK